MIHPPLSINIVSNNLDNLHICGHKLKNTFLLVQIWWSLGKFWSSQKEEFNAIIISIKWAIQSGIWPYFSILTLTFTSFLYPLLNGFATIHKWLIFDTSKIFTMKTLYLRRMIYHFKKWYLWLPSISSHKAWDGIIINLKCTLWFLKKIGDEKRRMNSYHWREGVGSL